MKQFQIQTINGQIVHDFVFELIEMIQYNNWYYGQEKYDYILTDTVLKDSDRIPVGSLDFVFTYLKYKPKPINIPMELRKDKYLKRTIYEANKKDIKFDKKLFVKSATEYKSFTGIAKSCDEVPEGTYIVSDVIDIKSEWRAFVFCDRLLDVRRYAGDFRVFPDIKLIEEMIKDYKTSPDAYTLDVGINNNGTFVIEVHPFVSCGLYGFSHYLLPEMFVKGFNSLQNNRH
ncbi:MULTISPECIES: ATP-grasp domain-containing protein [Thermoanaerobacterium]|uniref:ATP-grasp domain-containing protein n=3 Tax=Thermoanaerobacterium TaxID=28895 RepID=L0INM4_THETR|nr:MULTISPECIES: ATP-grasp domain-containing protein [Thermoanaerobacterium]AFK94289.1 hypothetical protein Tsac_2742 [Thermoanaerobacterium saccharolyticum JW/SL-YS485]AGB20463.1 hypothetical protein Thethe_02917 [Thermoanaerobacterium thermosaccharolyticum M0795]ETO39082.1 hypothetical protein V518_0789 [Thermoanaerobacterium aotearoense SCUT27]